MKQRYILSVLSSLVLGFVLGLMAVMLWPSLACADTLILVPMIPDKPKIDLVVDEEKGTVRDYTEKELLQVAKYDARKANFSKVKKELGRPLTGNYKQLIGSKGPVWSKDGIDYTISCFSDKKRIKGKIAVKDAQAMVIDTGKLNGREWLIENGYVSEAKGMGE